MAPVTLNSYYLDRPLSGAETAVVKELTGLDLVQVRIPYVLPTLEEGPDRALTMPNRSDDAPLAALKAAGILRDSGKRVLLVAPLEAPWVPRFGDAIARLTGRWPYLIQTDDQRAVIGNPGALRVLDLDAAMRD